MKNHSLLSMLLMVLLPLLANGFTLENGGLRIDISTEPSTFGSLLAFQQDGREALSSPSRSLWAATLVGDKGDTCVVDGTTTSISTNSSLTPNSSASLHWRTAGCSAGELGVDVNLDMTIANQALTLELVISPLAGGATLWAYNVSVSGVRLDGGSMSVLQNTGFGITHLCPSCKSFSTEYPQATFQFIGAYSDEAIVGAPGMYFGCHDPTAASKRFGANILPGSNRSSFSVTAVVPDAGRVGWQMFRAPPVVLAAHHTGWWDMAQIYRNWALREAKWTQKGPLSQRADVPGWLLNVTTWINSHWQGNDVFNTTGGDPAVVLNRVSSIAKRFSPGIGGDSAPLALHWYEWDTLGYKQGSNYTECETEITCGFDTHYPEYFPVRQGFQDALSKIQALGVRVAPYINGRIFDQATDSWQRDHASKWAAKNVKGNPRTIPNTGLNQSSLELYDEQYGSKAQFAVMCPYTMYWQRTIANVTDRLVNEYGTDGVYIDQIAAAGPRPCFDPAHNHSYGGGDHWVTGYRSMLDQVRSTVGNDKVVLTESNAEPFMDGVNVFLTLVGFSADFAGSSHTVPTFQAIYGGYFLAAGAEFFTTDFSPNPDVFAAKVAEQFLFGAQLGWFSLGGRNNQSPPMGIYNQLMDPNHDPEIAYLQKLSMARQRCTQWLVHGRAMPPVRLHVNQTTSRQGYSAVPGTAWLSDEERSLLVAITAVERDSLGLSLGFNMSMGAYGLRLRDAEMFELAQLGLDGSVRVLAQFKGDGVEYSGVLGARQVLLLSVSVVVP